MDSAILTNEQIKSVKSKGFLHNRGSRTFSGRIITKNGVLTAKQMEILSQAAELFGNGTVTFTVRLTVELPGIDFEQIEAFREFVGKWDMRTGGTGAKVRPIVACKGTTCVFGLYDTQELATEIHERFYEGYFDVVLPHKFKIAAGGCPNNCAKPDLNDLGIVGQRVPNFDIEACRGCGKCRVTAVCPMGAAKIENEKIKVNRDLCTNCGRCANKCYLKISNDSKVMYKIYVGGRWGKKIRMGSALNQLFTKEEALDVVERAILLFKSEGILGERFGETIDRIGTDKIEEMLICDTLLDDKEKILKEQSVIGVKC